MLCLMIGFCGVSDLENDFRLVPSSESHDEDGVTRTCYQACGEMIVLEAV